MNGLSAKIPYFCARYLVKAGKANVLYMAGFCAFICLLNGLYCGRFRQSVIIIRAMLLVEVNDVSPPPPPGLGETLASAPSAANAAV